MSRYQVVAPLVIAHDQEGHGHHVYQGGVIPWLSEAQTEHFLNEGLVVELDDDDEAADAGAKPPKNAAKPVLVEWVVANALKDDGSDYTEAEASDLNKDQLWDVIDSIED